MLLLVTKHGGAGDQPQMKGSELGVSQEYKNKTDIREKRVGSWSSQPHGLEYY